MGDLSILKIHMYKPQERHLLKSRNSWQKGAPYKVKIKEGQLSIKRNNNKLARLITRYVASKDSLDNQ